MVMSCSFQVVGTVIAFEMSSLFMLMIQYFSGNYKIFGEQMLLWISKIMTVFPFYISTRNHTLYCSHIALCSYPHVKVPIRDLSQTFTTALIFQQSHYFRQKYLEITTCAVSLLNNIWVRVEHSLLQQLNLKIINCSSGSLQAGCE